MVSPWLFSTMRTTDDGLVFCDTDINQLDYFQQVFKWFLIVLGLGPPDQPQKVCNHSGR